MTRQSLLLPGFIVLGLLLFALPSYGAWMQDRRTELPQDEQKLVEYAQQRMNTGDWKESDRAYKAYVAKFPEGKHLEQVYVQLGNLHHWYSNQYATSREWYLKACEKFPKSPNYWNYRFQAANTWQNQNLREKALEEYRKIAKEAPDASVRTSAIQQAWSVEGKYFYMHVNQSFTAGQEPFVNVQLAKIDKIVFRAEHIKFDAILEHLGQADGANLHAVISKVPKAGRRPLKEWTATYTYEKNNYWRNEQVKVPSTESGVYVVQGEHDGVVMTVTVLASQYGLITKASAGKLLCFAQDRATSKPVEGMVIRTLHAQKPLTGVTDANGVYIGDGFQGGVVIGVKGSELVTTQAYDGSVQGEHPLIYVTTDRPIYRPHHTVQFRVVHRSELGQKLLVKPGTEFFVEIRDPKGNKVYEKKHQVGDFGSTSGELVLGDEPPLGEYTILTRETTADANTHQWNWQWYGRWGNQSWNGVRFRVDEYRKPEYKVDVAFKKKTVLQGEDVEATVESKYYFGSPVVDAEVVYTVTRRGYWYSWRHWDFYYDWYIHDENGDGEDDGIYEGRRGRYRGPRGATGGEQVLQGKGKTDKDGKFVIPFTSQKWDHDAIYDVHAKVTDLSRRVVEGRGTCKATRAEFGLAMTLNKYVYKPGDKVNARVRATTADDKVVADQKITIKGYDRRWKQGNYDDAFLFEGTSKTDAQGIADFNFTPERDGGYLRLVAEAEDRKGNKVTTEHWVWLCGDSWYGDNINLNGLDLILDKKTYDIGDTARVLVTSQFKNVTFLFTVEGKEIHQHQVVALKGHTRMIEFKIDQSWYAPNVYIGVTAIKENAFIQKQKMIVVNPSEKFLKVEIKPDQAQYRPRNKARYEIVTTGADGRPVAAEVAFGIVDESIYALQDEYAWDIRKFFIHRRGIEVATATSLQYHDYGRADEKQKFAQGSAMDEARPASAPAPAAKRAAEGKEEADRNEGGGGAVYAATEVRSKFADTMIWKTVTTDAQGRAVVEVDIPDNLTTWKATARAMSKDSRFGQELNSVVCRKEMIVRLETPRFFTQNDETVISAIAHNYLGTEKNVKVELEAEGIEVTGEKSLIVKVAAEGQQRIDWKAKIRGAGKAVITVKALSDRDSDAMQLTIPVLAHGAMKWDSRAGVVGDKVTEKIVIPDGSVKGGSELLVCVSPTHAAMVLDALEYLAGYPYGCVEQTMSRFLPTVVVSQALQKLGIEKPELKAELPSMVATGLQRLYNFQQQDGGWGWWQHDQSNPWTTAYVMTGLALAREADHLVSAEVYARGQSALQQHLAKEKDPNTRTYLLYALRMSGATDEAARAQLTDKLGELNSYSKALLALVLKKDGRPTKDVIDALAKSATGTGGAARFEGGDRGGWQDHRIEVSAAALRAFIACDPKHELVPKLVSWLALARQGNYWASTKQTAMVVYAFVDYLALTGDLNPDMTVTLTLNGGQVFSERITKDNWQKFDGMRKFPASKLNAGENVITIEKTGNGSPIYSVYAKYYAEAEDMPASQGGIRVNRTYTKIVNDKGVEQRQKLESGATVTSGDEIEVTLTVDAERDYEWLMMDDPLPSGFEPIREYWGHYGWFWNYWYSRKEFRDQKVSIAMTQLRHGQHTASYRMRAETPGDFHALPSQVFNMYHPEIGANGSEFRIKVVDKK